MEEKRQTKNRVILHADVNNFFASVECSINPSLFNKPVAVTGNPNKRTGIILAKNEIAKTFGVKTGQTIGEAKALCPNLKCLPPHYEIYEEISQELQNIYLNYTNLVEPLGLDECWLDITGSTKYLGKNSVEIADELREIVKKELNLTISVGVSFSKIFAKLASDLRKPDFTTEIPYKNFKEITYTMPLNSIVGIGHRLEEKFKTINIKTIGDFITLDDEFLKQVMGITGVNLKSDLLGLRDVPILDYYNLPPPKSIGNGTTTIKDISRKEDIESVITFLSQKVSRRMINHKVIGSCITVKLKTNDFKTLCKSQKIAPTNSVKSIISHAMIICDKIYNYNYPIRAIRVKMSSLTSSNVKQLSIFDDEEKDFSQIMSDINHRYGKVFLASDTSSFINNTSSHHK